MLILLPIHLGEDVSGYDKVVIYEEPLLYNAHKVKCAFLRAIVMASGYKTITEKEVKKLPVQFYEKNKVFDGYTGLGSKKSCVQSI